MLRMPPSTVFVGVCSLAGVRRRRSPALSHERRVVRQATGWLDLGAGLTTANPRPDTPLTTHVPDPAGHAACSRALAHSMARPEAVASFAAFPAFAPAHLLHAETHASQTVGENELCPPFDTSAVVAVDADDSQSRTLLVQCDPLDDGTPFLAVIDRAQAAADDASLVLWARPPDGTPPFAEYANPFEAAPFSPSAPHTGERTTPEDDGPTCFVTLGPDDQLPLDFGDVVINNLRDD